MVMAYHFTTGMPLNRFASRLAAFGWVGVDLFFVLSGFLITGILMRTRERPDYLRTFYFRRSLRIFPVYYWSLAILNVGR